MIEHPIVTEAYKLLGHPSRPHSMEECAADRFGHGLSPELGFDYSGFIKYVLLNAELLEQAPIRELVREVRHCNEFYQLGLEVHYGLHQSGDLIFFTNKLGRVTKHMVLF